MKRIASYSTHIHRAGTMPALAIAAMLGLAMCCTYALAQNGAGSIQGTVTDSTDAVIPGATIHVVNQATNVAVDTKSNGVGFYQVPELYAGTYVITIATPGMETYKRTVDLLVAQTLCGRREADTGCCHGAGASDS